MAPMHRTADGTKMAIADMSNSHLLNTIRLHRRKAKEGLVISYGGGYDSEDMWYDEDHLYGEEALMYLKHNDYLKEAAKRGLRIE